MDSLINILVNTNFKTTGASSVGSEAGRATAAIKSQADAFEAAANRVKAKQAELAGAASQKSNLQAIVKEYQAALKVLDQSASSFLTKSQTFDPFSVVKRPDKMTTMGVVKSLTDGIKEIDRRVAAVGKKYSLSLALFGSSADMQQKLASLRSISYQGVMKIREDINKVMSRKSSDVEVLRTVEAPHLTFLREEYRKQQAVVAERKRVLTEITKEKAPLLKADQAKFDKETKDADKIAQQRVKEIEYRKALIHVSENLSQKEKIEMLKTLAERAVEAKKIARDTEADSTATNLQKKIADLGAKRAADSFRETKEIFLKGKTELKKEVAELDKEIATLGTKEGAVKHFIDTRDAKVKAELQALAQQIKDRTDALKKAEDELEKAEHALGVVKTEGTAQRKKVDALRENISKDQVELNKLHQQQAEKTKEFMDAQSQKQILETEQRRRQELSAEKRVLLEGRKELTDYAASMTGAFVKKGKDADRTLNVWDNLLKKVEEFNKKGAPDMESTLNSLSFAAAGVVYGVQNIGGAVFDVIKDFEQYKYKLFAITKDMQEANDLMSYMKEYAVQAPFDVRELTNAGTTLRVYNQDIKQTLPLVSALAAAMNQDLEKASLAFGRAMKGSTFGFRVLRESFGVSTEELAKFGAMVEKNKLILYAHPEGVKRATAALEALVKSKYGDFIAVQSKTLAVSVSNLRDAWVNLIDTLGKDYLPLIRGVVDGFRDLIGGLDKGIGWLKAWKSELKGTAAYFAELGDTFGKMFVGAALGGPAIFGGIALAFVGVSQAILQIKGLVAAIDVGLTAWSAKALAFNSILNSSLPKAVGLKAAIQYIEVALLKSAADTAKAYGMAGSSLGVALTASTAIASALAAILGTLILMHLNSIIQSYEEIDNMMIEENKKLYDGSLLLKQWEETEYKILSIRKERVSEAEKENKIAQYTLDILRRYNLEQLKQMLQTERNRKQKIEDVGTVTEQKDALGILGYFGSSPISSIQANLLTKYRLPEEGIDASLSYMEGELERERKKGYIEKGYLSSDPEKEAKFLRYMAKFLSGKGFQGGFNFSSIIEEAKKLGFIEFDEKAGKYKVAEDISKISKGGENRAVLVGEFKTLVTALNTLKTTDQKIEDLEKTVQLQSGLEEKRKEEQEKFIKSGKGIKKEVFEDLIDHDLLKSPGSYAWQVATTSGQTVPIGGKPYKISKTDTLLSELIKRGYIDKDTATRWAEITKRKDLTPEQKDALLQSEAASAITPLIRARRDTITIGPQNQETQGELEQLNKDLETLERLTKSGREEYGRKYTEEEKKSKRKSKRKYGADTVEGAYEEWLIEQSETPGGEGVEPTVAKGSSRTLIVKGNKVVGEITEGKAISAIPSYKIGGVEQTIQKGQFVGGKLTTEIPTVATPSEAVTGHKPGKPDYYKQVVLQSKKIEDKKKRDQEELDAIQERMEENKERINARMKERQALKEKLDKAGPQEKIALQEALEKHDETTQKYINDRLTMVKDFNTKKAALTTDGQNLENALENEHIKEVNRKMKEDYNVKLAAEKEFQEQLKAAKESGRDISKVEKAMMKERILDTKAAIAALDQELKLSLTDDKSDKITGPYKELKDITVTIIKLKKMMNEQDKDQITIQKEINALTIKQRKAMADIADDYTKIYKDLTEEYYSLTHSDQETQLFKIQQKYAEIQKKIDEMKNFMKSDEFKSLSTDDPMRKKLLDLLPKLEGMKTQTQQAETLKALQESSKNLNDASGKLEDAANSLKLGSLNIVNNPFIHTAQGMLGDMNLNRGLSPVKIEPVKVTPVTTGNPREGNWGGRPDAKGGESNLGQSMGKGSINAGTVTIQAGTVQINGAAVEGLGQAAAGVAGGPGAAAGAASSEVGWWGKVPQQSDHILNSSFSSWIGG